MPQEERSLGAGAEWERWEGRFRRIQRRSREFLKPQHHTEGFSEVPVDAVYPCTRRAERAQRQERSPESSWRLFQQPEEEGRGHGPDTLEN